MKPHFGQSDAAMNKLAGCNILPNNNKPADLLKLRNIPCSCVPCKHYEVSLDHGPCVSCRDHAKFQEKDFDPVKERDAAYDLGYKDAQKVQGYYGHELGCDCAVCEDCAQRESIRKIADAEWNKLMDENKKYCDALHIIAHMGISGLSWQHDFEKCVNIASEALGFARKNF